MKKLVLGLIAGTALIAAPAFAADLNEPIPAAPYAPPVASGFDWTGAYVGANLGTGLGQRSENLHHHDKTGIAGGVYGGYNMQVAPNVVVGGEADVNVGPSNSATDWSGSVRGRAGYAVNNFLVYGTAGLAMAEGTAKANGYKDDNTHVGYVVGAGVETALTNNITARAEYLYTDYNKQSYDVGSGGSGVKKDLDGSELRVGVGYKF